MNATTAAALLAQINDLDLAKRSANTGRLFGTTAAERARAERDYQQATTALRALYAEITADQMAEIHALRTGTPVEQAAPTPAATIPGLPGVTTAAAKKVGAHWAGLTTDERKEAIQRHTGFHYTRKAVAALIQEARKSSNVKDDRAIVDALRDGYSTEVEWFNEVAASARDSHGDADDYDIVQYLAARTV